MDATTAANPHIPASSADGTYIVPYTGTTVKSMHCANTQPLTTHIAAAILDWTMLAIMTELLGDTKERPARTSDRSEKTTLSRQVVQSP
jgi:hypothetical protein